MHFYNLVTVKNIPPVPKPENADRTEKLLDETAARKMKKLLAAQKKEPDNFYISLCIKNCELSGNQFYRAVLSKIGNVMEPTNIYTEDPKYLAFYPMEDELRQRFNTKKTDCVKLPDGRIRPINLNFKIIDGVVHQQYAGRLKHTIRTKKARKLKALPDYPLNKAFKSAEEYFEYCGLVYDAEYKEYGCYMNPCGYWDWYVIGGRRPDVFLVPESCREYCSVDIEMPDNKTEAPAGYRWVAAARKKDINWRLMHREYLKSKMQCFRAYRDFFINKKMQGNCIGKITDKGIAGFGEMLYLAGESMYENFVRRNIVNQTRYKARFCAFLDEDNWVDSDFSGNSENRYIKKLDEFIDSLDDNTVLVAVDCHN